MWQTDLVELTRAVLLDFDDPPLYTDDRIKRLVVSAAHFVISDMGLEALYEADLASTNITPDPTEYPNINPSLVNLIAIQAGCLMDNGVARRTASQAVDIRDGTSAVSIKGIADAALAVLKIGWCVNYNNQLMLYKIDNTKVVGTAVLSPFRGMVPGPTFMFDEDNCGWDENTRRSYRYGSGVQSPERPAY